jgi:phosphatidylglycerophosphate synthase
LDTYNFLRAVPRPFGAANWATLLRALIAVLLLAEAIAVFAGSLAPGAALRSITIACATAALGLDGLDGYLARRFGTASAFGARFDMETDAFTMLALAMLVWATGQAGAWVLVSGILRYIFVIGGWLWPVLALPLPPRKRRQTLCVMALIALILALAPPVTPLWGNVICLAGLILLSYSFAVDLAWLAGQAKGKSEAVW